MVGNLGTFVDVAAKPAVLGVPVMIRLCSSVMLAVQRDDVGALRRRGDRPRAVFRVVDVGRRPPRPRNHNKIRADAVYVYSSSDWTDAGLEGTGEEGMGPMGPRGVFL